MQRIRLTVEYDGTHYGGWQLQKNAPTVQGELERALSQLTGRSIRITGASRTDAGVHARGQVAHFDSPVNIPPEKFSYALNTHLPPDIRVQDSCAAPEGFHARFWTRGKRYTYTIYNARHASALLHDRSWHVWQPLDLEKMNRAARDLLGTHDFSAFCAAGGSEKTRVRTLTRADVERKDGGRVVITVEGNAFLYNMVRIIAGTLLRVGSGQMEPEEIPVILEAKDRGRAGETARPEGLTLVEIEYV